MTKSQPIYLSLSFSVEPHCNVIACWCRHIFKKYSWPNPVEYGHKRLPDTKIDICVKSLRTEKKWHFVLQSWRTILQDLTACEGEAFTAAACVSISSSSDSQPCCYHYYYYYPSDISRDQQFTWFSYLTCPKNKKSSFFFLLWKKSLYLKVKNSFSIFFFFFLSWLFHKKFYFPPFCYPQPKVFCW